MTTTLYLRNRNKKSIVDLMIYVTWDEGERYIELKSGIVINTYSELLMNNLDRANEIIDDFHNISELRGWLWETYFLGGDNDPEQLDDVIAQVSEYLKEIAKKYDLAFIVD